MAQLPPGRSAFLFGPRGVGKTVLSHAFLKTVPQVYEADLLSYELFQRYLTQPGLFRREIEQRLTPNRSLTVFVDEVQKLPALLDEVHALIERHKPRVRFLLTGSSARKLKRGGANLLAGRAWTLRLHPLTHREGVEDLPRALQLGTLPAIYLEEQAPERALKAYVETYLKEEILQEALVRKVDGFIRFLDVAGQMNGEPVNAARVARDCGVSTNTAIEFFSILVDTLVTFRIDGWSYSARKQLRQSPKFYWFDCGVLNAIRGELAMPTREGSARFGRLFETFVVQELIRFNDYTEAGFRFAYWRTNSGLEVDLILSRGPSEPPIAIEIKSSRSPAATDMHGLRSFHAAHPKARLLCLSLSPRTYKIDRITVAPWRLGIQEIFALPA